MGGIGSGNRWRWGSRDTCEGSKRIDLRYMRGKGMLRPGYAGSLSWSLGGAPAGSICFQMHEHGLELIYRTRLAGESQWRDVREILSFAFTAQPIAGRRRWFLCPSCRRRCSVLYGGERFRCRRCLNLAYQSQHEEPVYRALSQARKLRKRLGGSECLDDPFPDKPKGMHKRTYDRLAAHGAVLEERTMLEQEAMLLRLVGGLKERGHRKSGSERSGTGALPPRPR